MAEIYRFTRETEDDLIVVTARIGNSVLDLVLAELACAERRRSIEAFVAKTCNDFFLCILSQFLLLLQNLFR